MPCKISTIVTNVVRILLRNIPGCTLRIVMPGEEETTDKATITFVKDLKKSGISRPEQEAQAGQEQGVSAGDRGRDTGHHEEPGSEQGGSRADSGQSLVEDTSTPASTQEYSSETIKGGLCSRLYWFS